MNLQKLMIFLQSNFYLQIFLDGSDKLGSLIKERLHLIFL